MYANLCTSVSLGLGVWVRDGSVVGFNFTVHGNFTLMRPSLSKGVKSRFIAPVSNPYAPKLIKPFFCGLTSQISVFLEAVRSQSLEAPLHCMCGNILRFFIKHSKEFYCCFSSIGFHHTSLIMIL